VKNGGYDRNINVLMYENGKMRHVDTSNRLGRGKMRMMKRVNLTKIYCTHIKVTQCNNDMLIKIK
jgi:hypothetical protein